jgi:hypothetical protein
MASQHDDESARRAATDGRFICGFFAIASFLIAGACYVALGVWALRMVMMHGGVVEAFRAAHALGWDAVIFTAGSFGLGTAFLSAGTALLRRKRLRREW